MRLYMDMDILIKDSALVLTDRKGKAVTFSREQPIQKNVAMITVGELSGIPKKQIAEVFGYKTRKSYYDIRDAVLNGRPEDLLPRRRGPKKPPKRTREFEKRVIQMRFDTTLNMYEIAAELKRDGFDIGPRLVGQVLMDYGLSKKNLR